MIMNKPIFKRVLLKLSGESLLGNQVFGIDQNATLNVALLVKELADQGVQIGIVIGGGNIFRGIQQGTSLGIERTRADHIGMLATLMNGIVLQQALLQVGCDTHLMSAIECRTVAEPYNWELAMNHLSKGRILVFVGGTGNPYFTTDTAAALRASEIRAEIFLKATTKVDGIYNKDPLIDKDAIKYTSLSYTQFLSEKLRVLDSTAVALCMSNQIPIRVFNLYSGSLLNAVSEHPFGTIIQ